MAEDERTRQQVILEEVLPTPGPLTDDAWRLEVTRKLDDITELLKQILLLAKRDVGSGGLGH